MRYAGYMHADYRIPLNKMLGSMIHLMRWDLISYAIIYRCAGNWSRTTICAHWRRARGTVDLCCARGTTSSCHLVQGNHSNWNNRTTFTTGIVYRKWHCFLFCFGTIFAIGPQSLSFHRFDNPTFCGFKRRMTVRLFKVMQFYLVKTPLGRVNHSISICFIQIRSNWIGRFYRIAAIDTR